MKVLLVEESTPEALPDHLEEIVRSVTSQLGDDVTESDLTVAVLFVLMMEVGFSPVDPENRDRGPFYGNEFNLRRLQTATLPSSWRRDSGSTYDLQFRLEPLLDTPCSLLLVSAGQHLVDNLIVNLLVPGLESRGRCLCLHPSRYVQRTRQEFRNLRELSFTFKDAVAHPVRSEMLQTNALLNPSLLGIPWELLLQICALLSVHDLGALARTNRELWMLSRDQTLWRHLVERDFGTEALLRDPGEEGEVNWRNEYRNRYTIRNVFSRPFVQPYKVPLLRLR